MQRMTRNTRCVVCQIEVYKGRAATRIHRDEERESVGFEDERERQRCDDDDL